MAARVVIIDTSLMCCWLRVPGKETAGPDTDRWDYARVNGEIEASIAAGSTFVLPVATLIETGNHIAKAGTSRYECAQALADHIRSAAEEKSPWTAFTEQNQLWSIAGLRELADTWPKLAAQRISIGDATITKVAEYYAQSGMSVSIFTGDAGLKSYEPSSPVPIPRRRTKRS